MMIIRDDEKRTNAHTAPRQFRNDSICDLLTGGSDVVQRHDHEIPWSSAGCDEGKELRCRNCTHLGIFGLDTALNKAKGLKNDEILMTNDELMTKPE
jgi:hypothetical protein